MTVRLNEATVVLWRADRSVQLELGSRRLVLENVRESDLRDLLPARYRTGSRTASTTTKRPGARDQATLREPDGEPSRALQIAEALADTGLLVAQTDVDPSPPTELAGYLRTELAALGALCGEQSLQILQGRARASVAIHGASRIAVTVACTLAAAGVGHVHLMHGGDVSAAQTCPGGLDAADEGRRFATAGSSVIHRAAPRTQTGPTPPGVAPDLVILTDSGPVEPNFASSLHADSLPHLMATADGSRAVIGPLVLPGRTSCLRCADLSRADRDPDWPLLAMQLATRPAHRSAPHTALSVAAAGLAAGQALAYLDGSSVDAIDGTLEWLLPTWRLRRRTWRPHPRCGCGALQVGEQLLHTAE